jgi:23S rRNA pseudouridine1911/1915/1917 synthase
MPDIEIIFEDEHLLVASKPAGLGTQAPRQFDSMEARVRGYLQESAEQYQTPYLGIPHRLDRCASGVMVFAKQKTAARRLSKQFEHRDVEKIYLAIVSGHVQPKSGEWRDFVRKIPDQPKAEIVPEDHQEAKLAILDYNVVEQAEAYAKLRVRIETGRMHQIRIQCAARGLPVFGDVLYGSTQSYGHDFEHDRDRQIGLHAVEIQFEHPQTREQLSFNAPLPACWPE